MFYMGIMCRQKGGGLKEIRFDKAYLSEADISETREIPDGEEEREDRKSVCRSQMEKLPVPGEDPGQTRITEYRFKTGDRSAGWSVRLLTVIRYKS